MMLIEIKYSIQCIHREVPMFKHFGMQLYPLHSARVQVGFAPWVAVAAIEVVNLTGLGVAAAANLVSLLTHP